MSAEADAAQKAADDFIQEVWGLQGAGYVVLGLRYFTHFYMSRPLAWDDFLMLLATVGFQALFDSQSQIDSYLRVSHTDHLHGRIGSRLLCCSILERSREQWHDGRAEGDPPAHGPRVSAPRQRLQDSRHRAIVVHDGSLAAEGLLGCLLQSNDVRLPAT